MLLLFFMKILQNFNKRPITSFTPGSAYLSAPLTQANNGWVADQERKGVLVVDKTDPRPIIFIPNSNVCCVGLLVCAFRFLFTQFLNTILQKYKEIEISGRFSSFLMQGSIEFLPHKLTIYRRLGFSKKITQLFGL